MVNEAFSASTMVESCREIIESVDAGAPVDAENAPTSGLQNRKERSFAERPHSLCFLGKKNEERTTKTAQPNCPPNRIGSVFGLRSEA
jgi:hypothetical protein